MQINLRSRENGIITDRLILNNSTKKQKNTPNFSEQREYFTVSGSKCGNNNYYLESERYVGTGLSHSIPLVERLVKEYKEGFESRHIIV
ncbi:hypothetical protein BpHYR1_012350 [Brachionus plicatilis]|uniref:Uncharacterized protein n=1 Tax=Brachionus plicatilis TaxID=10195 RepID=A0A3M7PT49_BRAPC|nr:hypothetical protein BpHYR1_012350 [Brachionus plicatilis]